MVSELKLSWDQANFLEGHVGTILPILYCDKDPDCLLFKRQIETHPPRSVIRRIRS